MESGHSFVVVVGVDVGVEGGVVVGVVVEDVIVVVLVVGASVVEVVSVAAGPASEHATSMLCVPKLPLTNTDPVAEPPFSTVSRKRVSSPGCVTAPVPVGGKQAHAAFTSELVTDGGDG